MHIKPLRGMVGKYGKLRRDQVVTNLPDDYARSLIKRGLAVPVQASDIEGKEEGAKQAPARPPEPGRTGGRNGAKAKRSSSSPAGRAQPSSRSKPAKDEAG